jgi:hypothetical protein
VIYFDNMPLGRVCTEHADVYQRAGLVTWAWGYPVHGCVLACSRNDVQYVHTSTFPACPRKVHMPFLRPVWPIMCMTLYIRIYSINGCSEICFRRVLPVTVFAYHNTCLCRHVPLQNHSIYLPLHIVLKKCLFCSCEGSVDRSTFLPAARRRRRATTEKKVQRS